jgi:hypothetical protein
VFKEEKEGLNIFCFSVFMSGNIRSTYLFIQQKSIRTFIKFEHRYLSSDRIECRPKTLCVVDFEVLGGYSEEFCLLGYNAM